MKMSLDMNLGGNGRLNVFFTTFFKGGSFFHVMVRVVVDSRGRKYLFQDKDVHTKDGFVKKEVVAQAEAGDVLETNLGKTMTVLDASFLDLYKKIKRGAQVIPLKDVGALVAEVGLSPDWTVVDAGAGSGALCCFLAHLVPKGKVHTYDVREDHLKIVQHNIEFLGLKNIAAKLHDIYTGIPVKKVDLITLDVPEPWEVIKHAEKALNVGGWLVSYSPCVPQVGDFVDAVKESSSLSFFKTIEILQRDWEFHRRKQRPMTQQIGHSGFLTFCRKMKK